MTINFYKYQGTGNDFIIIDNRRDEYSFMDKNDISKLCHRKFGIGADGLIFLENANGFDFQMRYFNSDGLEASMCGNGGRCIVAFAGKLNIIKDKAKFLAVDGIHSAILQGHNYVELSMGDVSDVRKTLDGYYLNTGSPHFVRIVTNTGIVDVDKEGKALRHNDEFSPNGTNVNFVEINNDDSITMRTYERGVEAETLSCGTGAVAASLCTFFFKRHKKKINISTLGGDLSVKYQITSHDDSHKFDDIWLCGKVNCVYKGEFIY